LAADRPAAAALAECLARFTSCSTSMVWALLAQAKALEARV
jgi:hypothetical protein